MQNFRQIVELSNAVHPNTKGLTRIKKNLRFTLWGVMNPKVIRKVHQLKEKSNLSNLLEQNPKIFEKPLKPFICIGIKPKTRASLLHSHFELLERTFGPNTVHLHLSNFELLTFADRNGDEFRIETFSGESREGSLGIRLVEANTGLTIYSVTFNISDNNGRRTMHIGCLQGTNKRSTSSQDKIKELTRSLHGLRPKSLMVELATMFANYMKVNEILTVSNKGHIYQAMRYIGSKRSAITFDYDTLWTENGASLVDKHWFSLPIKPLRKDTDTLKKTKRRLYTKRYDWLKQTEEQLISRLNDIKSAPKLH